MRKRSRTIGVVYLGYFVTVICGAELIAPKNPLLGEVVVSISNVVYVVLSALFYVLFRNVDRVAATAALVLSVVGCVLTEMVTLSINAPVNPLVFFGPFNMLIGYLILRSAAVPRVFGALMIASGIAWLMYCIPALAAVMNTPAKLLGVLAEGLLMLWLLVVGVDAVGARSSP